MIKSAMDFHPKIITYAGCTTKKASLHHRGEAFLFICLNNKEVINHGYSHE